MEEYLERIFNGEKELEERKFIEEIERWSINIGSDKSRTYLFKRNCEPHEIPADTKSMFPIFWILEKHYNKEDLMLKSVLLEYPNGFYSRIYINPKRELFAELTTLEKIRIHSSEDYRRLMESEVPGYQ